MRVAFTDTAIDWQQTCVEIARDKLILLRLYNLLLASLIKLPDANVLAMTFTGTLPLTSTVKPKRIQLLTK